MTNLYNFAFLFMFWFIFPLENITGQNYIGLYKDEIRRKMPAEYSGFVFEKEVANGNRSFIKFVNTFEEQTFLCMLNKKGYCTSCSRMYNTWLYNQVKKELDQKFKPLNSNTWIETIRKKKFEVTLKKGEWFITVTTRPCSKKK